MKVINFMLRTLISQPIRCDRDAVQWRDADGKTATMPSPASQIASSLQPVGQQQQSSAHHMNGLAADDILHSRHATYGQFSDA